MPPSSRGSLGGFGAVLLVGVGVKIAAVAKALPPHYYDQETLVAALRDHWRDAGSQRALDRLLSIHKNVMVNGRHLALPLEEYPRLATWAQANDAWIRVAERLGVEAIGSVIDQTGIERERIGALFFVSVTGVATPSIDARVISRLSLPCSIKRVPIFGLGCVAGAAGTARAADYVRAYPHQAAVLLSVELCSLTLQRDDLSVANLIASGLFGDGAAAVMVTGDDLSVDGPSIIASRSIFYPGTERVMGWDITERGFKVVLSPEVPEMVRRHLRANVDGFLEEHQLSRSDISRWICHPGGPRVIDAMLESLELEPQALELTWRSLQTAGNLSSTSVLFVLADTIRDQRPPTGSYGMMLAMGPGFCSELVLLRW
ncbi:MAG: type III polyketide synthase [Acidobacteriota bacterium]|nr:MAG: type III polyketide synthase [Acidobacteriota bacterium]